MGESAQKLLEIKNLSKNFGGINAVEDFSMSMEKGELHCLIGPNGAGKQRSLRWTQASSLCPPERLFLKDRTLQRKQQLKELKEESALKCRYLGCLET